MEKKEYNATGQLLDFIPKFYLGLIPYHQTKVSSQTALKKIRR